MRTHTHLCLDCGMIEGTGYLTLQVSLFQKIQHRSIAQIIQHFWKIFVTLILWDIFHLNNILRSVAAPLAASRGASTTTTSTGSPDRRTPSPDLSNCTKKISPIDGNSTWMIQSNLCSGTCWSVPIMRWDNFFIYLLHSIITVGHQTME